MQFGTNEGNNQFNNTALAEVPSTERRTTQKVEESREQQVSRCQMRREQGELNRLVRGQCCDQCCDFAWSRPIESMARAGMRCVADTRVGNLLLFLSASRLSTVLSRPVTCSSPFSSTSQVREITDQTLAAWRLN